MPAIATCSPKRETGATGSSAQDDARACGFPSSLSDVQLGQFAVEALIEEAQLTPKPALVDRRGSGAHRDLDLAKMIRSARALEPTFVALARASRSRAPSTTLRAELAQIGRAGEVAMMQATDGSNAHRGAIWILGLMVAGAVIRESVLVAVAADVVNTGSAAACAAASRSAGEAVANVCVAHASGSSATDTPARRVPLAARVCELGAQIACFPDRFAAPANSHGERVRQRYQVGGARREAQDGFPHVIDVGLPALHAARAKDITENAARVDTLLAIMASLDDTCLLHRAGLDGLRAGQQGARRVLAGGGSSTAQGASALAALEHALLSLNASPGGAADLLAATLFLDKLVQHHTTGSATVWNI